MVFVTGFYGAGKSTYSEMLSIAFSIPHFSAGKILIDAGLQSKLEKQVKNVEKNQQFLINKVHSIRLSYSDFILDGHMTLFNEFNEIESVDKKVLLELGVTDIIYLLEDVKVIYNNLLSINIKGLSEKYLKELIQYDLEYVQTISKELGVPLHVVKNSIPSTCRHTILMPIKKEFADRILLGEKKFEFRKRLSAQACSEMLLYATAPYKKVIGKVDILGKVSLTKELLWDYASKKAGTDKETFLKYFSTQDIASAYVLGRAEKFDPERSLADYGISYTPQSYVFL